jgi:hypothetical protein
MEFNAAKNTDLLWKTLYDSGKFNGYTKEKLQLAHTLFEETILTTQKWNMKTLLDHNKKFIQVYLAKLKESNPVLTNYKQEDISYKRTAELDSLYHEKTAEFNAFVPSPPKNIDFSDTKTTTDNPLEPLLREILSNQKLILSYLAADKQQVLETDLISLA